MSAPAAEGTRVVSRTRGVLQRRTAAGLLVLRPGTAVPVQVEGPAQALWELLERPLAMHEAAAELDRLSDGAVGDAAAVTDQLVAQLSAAGLVVVDDREQVA